jgi:hypothetical protein
MRTKFLLVLLVVGVVVIGLRGQLIGAANSSSGKTSSYKALPVQPPEPPKPINLGKIEARGDTEEDVREIFRDKAAKKIQLFLAGLQPPVKWDSTGQETTVDKSIIDQKILSEVVKDDIGLEKNRFIGTCQVELSPLLVADLMIDARQTDTSQRLWLAAKILGGLLALVLVVGGYFYLDEATKGGYRIMLRLAALTVLSAIGVTIWIALNKS